MAVVRLDQSTRRGINVLVHSVGQLVRSVLLLAHCAALTVLFVGRLGRWTWEAIHWIELCARYAVSFFDGVTRCLHWLRFALGYGWWRR